MAPIIYNAVRSVGVLKPKFQGVGPGKVFADSLDVLGTAFWVKDKKVLITCAHVISRLAESPLEISGLLVVGNNGGDFKRARIGVVDYSHDIAILHLVADEATINQESATGLSIASAYPEVGNRVGYAGFPLGQQLLASSHHPTYAVGVIGARVRTTGTRKDIQISGPVVGGYSGSPIVTEEKPDEVIAIVSNSPSAEAGQAGIFMATSWEHLIHLAALGAS